MNITKFWGGRASSSSRAALGCVFPIVLLACSDAGADRRVAVPPDVFDSGELADSSESMLSDICVANEQYIAERKACNSDADCSALMYQETCCDDLIVAAIASEYLANAAKCTKPVCNCEPGLMRAEDGRVITEGVSRPVVQCIEQRCFSRVTQRQCGAKKICTPNEICVTYENVPGGFPPDPDSGDNAYLTFRCEPNPCVDHLDCACAQSLCDARNDATRRCEIRNNEESDLTCRPFVD